MMCRPLRGDCRPRGEPPAWQITGWPCGERGALSGPAAFVVLAVVVDRVHLLAVGENHLLAVHHDRVGFPGIPELLDQFGELVGHVVAAVMLVLLSSP